MNSILNPDAPEFYPHLETVTQNGYTSVNKTLKASTYLPSGESQEILKTFTNFNIIKCQLTENIIVQSNQIVINELPTMLKNDDLEHNMETIIDVNDVMLDRVNINIDAESGTSKPNDQLVNNSRNVSAWNDGPVHAKIKMGSTSFFGAKHIPRPQLTFKDTIDNSENLWVPKITEKPNNIKPLALNLLYNDDGEAIGYEHPYKEELDLYHPPLEFTNRGPEPPIFPPRLEETNFTYIDTVALLDELVKHLETVKELAIDLEHHAYRTYQGITCLMQITTNEGGDFILDTLALREHIYRLNVIFTNPTKVKVFHGAESDVLWLQRDFGVYVVGLFDTHQAAKALKFPGLGLKNLLMYYCNVDIDKKYQLADWRIRPLPQELIDYARMDTHYLLYIWRQMKHDLLQAAAEQPQLLLSVFEQSRQVCGLTYNKEIIKEDSHMPMYIRSRKLFNARQMAALKILYKWRDSQARLLDESPKYLLPNHMMLALAESLPREVQGVNAICYPVPPFVKQNLITIHKMLLSCRQLPVEPQLYQMPTSIRNMVNAVRYTASYNVHDLSHFPDISEEQQVNMDNATLLTKDLKCQPDILAFKDTSNSNKNKDIVSSLNVDAKLFIPPYERYRKYRSLAQVEEMEEYKCKEAKIAAISKGNELIETEVLAKVQQAKEQIEYDTKKKGTKVDDVVVSNNVHLETKSQRKRKISSDKVEGKDDTDRIIQNPTKETKPNHKLENIYKNINYKKFYSDKDTGKANPKMKFRKQK